MSCENCLKKQDEIEQYKTQWQNAEDSNIKLSEKILEYRKEIERLKKECELWRSEFNRIQELDISNFDTWTKYDLQREVTRLTARNKELENYPFRVRAEKAEAQMEIYRLETIRWKEAYEPLNEKYKELESKLKESKESHTAGQRMRLCEKIHFLESKIAAAREVLKVFAERNPENDPCQPLAKKALAELGEKQ